MVVMRVLNSSTARTRKIWTFFLIALRKSWNAIRKIGPSCLDPYQCFAGGIARVHGVPLGAKREPRWSTGALFTIFG
jgi:hypothetical protein